MILVLVSSNCLPLVTILSCLNFRFHDSEFMLKTRFRFDSESEPEVPESVCRAAAAGAFGLRLGVGSRPTRIIIRVSDHASGGVCRLFIFKELGSSPCWRR